MTRNFLSEIVMRKREMVAKYRASSSVNAVRARACEVRKNAAKHRLRQVLDAPSPALKIVAEFKRASPSVGIIRGDLSAANIARDYQRGGACAISVLTDEEHFGGSIDDLRAVRSSTHLPVLRKDFMIDAIQIYEAAIAGADAILLIVAALDDDSLGGLRKVAEDELGLDALIEVHTSDELRRAVDTGAKISGVNNLEDARVCAELGADMIGLNFYPRSSRYIEPQRAREMVKGIPRSVRAVGVFVDPTASEVRNAANAAGIECVQLHGDLSA